MTEVAPGRAGVLAAFAAFRDALFAQDVEALDRLLAIDYRGYNLQGHLEGREVVLAAYAPGGVSLERFDVSDLQDHVVGSLGVLTGEGVVAGSSDGYPWYHRLRFCDVYELRDGAWRLLLSHATPMDDAE